MLVTGEVVAHSQMMIIEIIITSDKFEYVFMAVIVMGWGERGSELSQGFLID